MRKASRERERSPARRAVALLVGFAAAVLGGGCEPARNDGEAVRFRVESFNQAGLDRVPLNSVLVFTFSTSVNPLSVNSDTVRISTTLGGQRRPAEGSFVVNDRTVSWFPRMTSRALVANVADEGDSAGAVLPTDAGLNTAATGLLYEVVIPARPSPNTVRDRSLNRTLHEPYVARFRTAPPPDPRDIASARDLAPLFSRDVPYVRYPLRVADVLAYARGAFLDWMREPALTAGENPLFLNPALLASARDAWREREVSGEWVDQLFGIQLVPRLTAEELKDCTQPAGVSLRDERLLSNRLGSRPGRPKEVTGLRVFFTQPVVPDAFLPAAGPDHPVEVRLLSDPTDDPEAAPLVPCAAAIHNDSDLQAGELALTFPNPIRRGWIHLRIDAARVTGFPGTRLEGNRESGFVFLWPVEIRAE